MFINVFGGYLVKKQILTEEQLDVIVMSSQRTRVKLGLIAVSEKMITQDQADEINRKQAVMDKRFGDIAMQLGYLNSSQVSRLLDLQGNAYMTFCQIAVDEGYMTLDEIGIQFKHFADSIGLKQEDFDSFKADDIDTIIPTYIPDFDTDASKLAGIAIRTFIRLISSNISIEKGYVVEDFSAEGLAYQELKGEKEFITGITGTPESVVKMASVFGEEEFEKVDEDSLDALGEFINIINGLFATSLSYKKIKVDMMPPVLSVKSTSVPALLCCVIPVIFEGNEIKLIIGYNK